MRAPHIACVRTLRISLTIFYGLHEFFFGLCNEALTWGYTSRVLHSAAEALLELGKIAHLNGKDAKALDCFEKANERLLEIEGSYEGFDKVERLQTEAQLANPGKCVKNDHPHV